MNKARYTIGELAKAADVTPRTIRFYAAEGLLSPPISEGRNAVYTGSHFVRLQLIHRLKSAFLPLNAIRTHIEGLSDEQVRILLGEDQPVSAAAQAEDVPVIRVRAVEPHSGQDSLEYLAQILAVTGQGAAQAAGSTGTNPGKRALLVSPIFKPETGSSIVTDAAATDSESGDVWERIRVNTKMELHARSPLTPEDRRKIEQIIARAKSLFSEVP